MTRFFQFVAAGLLLAAAPAQPPERHPAPRPERTVPHDGPVPGVVLIGMAVAGLAIVGVSARRRQPGRRVTS